MADATFTDSTGAERQYPEGMAETERDEYRAWWEGVVEANAHNHDRPVALTSGRNYDALAEARGLTDAG